MLLNSVNISKSFDSQIVLEDVSFLINKGDKLALIGINGSGKTTLLKIILGEIEVDDGQIIKSNGLKIGSLAQFDTLNDSNTIYSEVLSEKQEILDLFKSAKELEEKIEKTSEEKYLRAYGDIIHSLEDINAYAYESEVRGIIKGVGFDEKDFNTSISFLSGGERARIELAKLLLSKPDLLILDEPTNHLDLESVQWLENYIKGIDSTVIVVSHDRYFLDKIATRVLEIRNHNSIIFDGNYSEFIVKRDERYEASIKLFKKQQAEIKHQEDVIKKLRQFNREKSIKRANSRQKLLDKINVMEDPTEYKRAVDCLITPCKTTGEDVLFIELLGKSFDGRKLFDEVNVDIKKSDRVALVGANGCGKTTLLKILLKEETADCGSFKWGANADIGYYDQKQESFDEEATIFEEVHDRFPIMTNLQIRNSLAGFLFYGDDINKRIKSLSGGERARVALCCLFLKRPNILVLDEPTNHLDIPMREALENIINSYEGTVIFVSHDRWFINNVCDYILSFENGKLVKYYGDYDYYCEKRENQVIEIKTDIAEKGSEWKDSKEKNARLRRLKKSVDNGYKKIEYLENEIEINQKEFEREDLMTDFSALNEISLRIEALENELYTVLEELEKDENELNILQ